VTHPAETELKPLIGRELFDAYNEIQDIASAHHFSIVILGPHMKNIATQSDRLNVHRDEDFIITEFTIG
jgi:hypothetical protein